MMVSIPRDFNQIEQRDQIKKRLRDHTIKVRDSTYISVGQLFVIWLALTIVQISCSDWDWLDNINKWFITNFFFKGSKGFGILLNYLWKESKRYGDVWGVALFWAPAASWGAGDGHLIDIFQQVNSKDFPSGLPFYQTQVWSLPFFLFFWLFG